MIVQSGNCVVSMNKSLLSAEPKKKCWVGEGEQIINILVNSETKTMNLVD